MGKAMFYHLTQGPLEATLPMILERSLGAGWQVVVRGTDRARLEWLDEKLWLGPEDGFLPHGLAGGAHDALQPVLLTTAGEVADCIIAIDGAEVRAEEVGAAERVCVMFDGHDQSAVAQARVQWKTLTTAGCVAEYWSQESGRWEKKAESGT